MTFTTAKRSAHVGPREYEKLSAAIQLCFKLFNTTLQLFDVFVIAFTTPSLIRPTGDATDCGHRAPHDDANYSDPGTSRVRGVSRRPCCP